VLGGYVAITRLPGMLATRRLERRLREVSSGPDDLASDEASIVARPLQGSLPAVDKLVARTAAGSRLSRLIEQSGLKTTPGAIVVFSVVFAAIGAIGAQLATGQWPLAVVAALAAGSLPTVFLVHKRSMRLRKFEEQFPEALDLLARALRAGHAFQTALGMAGDELKAPVGPEFKKTFDQQNFGLPLRDALHQLSERIPLLDVRFFVTAVLIQRETGGNLSEILDNLAHVVRERFKILRQVRVYTAHGRFTAFVLLSLPAVLAVVLYSMNPKEMNLLLEESVGQMMIMAVIVMQSIGFVWIRKVIKIEV
jgi:tight adherence protein B